MFNIVEQHVVTSAHCIQEKQSRELKKPQNALFYIGKHNLKDDFETGFQKIGAQSKLVTYYALKYFRDWIHFIIGFDVHPQWDAFSEKYDADIAIVVLVK